MAIGLTLDPNSAEIHLGPVQPQGDHKLDALVDQFVTNLNARNVFDEVNLSKPAPRTYTVDVTFPSEFARNVFRWEAQDLIGAAEADPDIVWGGGPG